MNTVVTPEVWQIWWDHNKHRLLNLRHHADGKTTTSGSINALTGRGRTVRSDASGGWRPTAQQVEVQIIPLLTELIATSDERDILDSAVVALGRVSRRATADRLASEILPLLGHHELSVQAGAALALGILGSTEASRALREVLGNTAAGRQLVGGAVPDLVRAFAALSLGLLGNDASVALLLDVMQRLPDSQRDIKVCAIVALGLLDAVTASEHDVSNELLIALGDRRLDAVIKSYVATTLGKLGDRTALGSLHEILLSRDSDDLVRQSSAIALGRVATLEDAPVIRSLLDAVRQGKNRQLRHFALIALGEIGARGAADGNRSAGAEEQRQDILGLLGGEIAGKGKSSAHRSWAALAAALLGREDRVAGQQLTERISVAYGRESDPAFRGAFAISLGLLGDRSSAAQLHDDLLEVRDPELQGHLAVALGLLGHEQSATVLRSRCQSKTTHPTLRLAAATGLGLLRDSRAVPVLIETLSNARTLGVSAGCAKGLGLLGSARALEPLTALAADERAPDLARGFACIALGILGEKTDLPWNAAIAADHNYRATVPAIAEALDIL